MMMMMIIYFWSRMLPFPFGEGFEFPSFSQQTEGPDFFFLLLKAWVFAPSHVSGRWRVEQHLKYRSVAGLRGCIAAERAGPAAPLQQGMTLKAPYSEASTAALK